MATRSPEGVTQLLERWSHGDEEALAPICVASVVNTRCSPLPHIRDIPQADRSGSSKLAAVARCAGILGEILSSLEPGKSVADVVDEKIPSYKVVYRSSEE